MSNLISGIWGILLGIGGILFFIRGCFFEASVYCALASLMLDKVIGD